MANQTTRKAGSGKRTTRAPRKKQPQKRRARTSPQRVETPSKSAFLASIKTPGIKVLVSIGVILAILLLGWWGVSESKRSAQWEHDHKWQSTVERAEDYFGVDCSFTNCMLTILQVESSGNEDIDKRHDIAQAWEGDGSKYMKKGVKSEGVEPYTVEASIYAGVCELSLCVRDFEEYLGYEPDPANLNDLALLTQGYNYGHLGWFSWLKSEGITEWTLGVSKRYQERIDGLGTAIHGQKIMDTYLRVSKKR